MENNIEVWKQWVPINDYIGLMYNIKTEVCNNCLILDYENESGSKKMTLRFEKGFFSFRNTEEGSFEKTFENMITKKADEESIKRYPWLMFMVENSNYVKFFNKQSMDIYKHIDIQHYVIISDDIITEVLSTTPPIVIVN